MDFENMCRICLTKDDLSDLFQKNDEVSVPDKLKDCGCLSVYEGDGLPTRICRVCLADLNVAFEFKQRCKYTERALKKYLLLNHKETNETADSKDLIEFKVPLNVNLKVTDIVQDTIKEEIIVTPDTQHLVNGTKEKKVKKKIHGIRAQPTLCDTCGKSFRYSSELSRHKRTHTGLKPHICSICKFQFAEASQLKRHLVLHTGIKKHKCPTCDKAFAEMTNVRKHIRAVHIVERNLECSECKKTFQLSSQLKVHMRTHTGEKPYSCTECPQKFSHMNSFKRHLRVHSGERPYCCSECGASFSDGANFRAHTRLHTGETPYKCPICNKGYAQSSNLKSHMRSHKK